MNTKQNKNIKIEVFAVTLLASLFVILGAFVPALSTLLLFLAVPYAYITAKHGIRSGIYSVVFSTVIIMAILGSGVAIASLISGGLNGLCVGMLIRKKVKPSITIFIATIVFLITILLASPINGEMINQEISEVIDQYALSFTESLKSTTDVTNASEVDISKQEEKIKETANIIRTIIPSIIVTMALFSSFINCMLTRIMLIRTKVSVAPMQKFRFFRLPESIVLGTIIFTGATYLSGKLGIINSEILFSNIVIIMLYIYALQGLSVLTYIFLEMKKSILIKIVVLTLVIMSGGLTSLALIGFMDVVINTRKLIQKRAG